MKSDGVTPNQLWQNDGEFKLAESESRPVIRRFHIGRASLAGAAATNLAGAVEFAGTHFSKPESQQPLSVQVTAPVPQEKRGPIIVQDSFRDVPVVESHDVFSVR